MFDNFFALAANLVESRLLHFSTERFGGFSRKVLFTFFDNPLCRIMPKAAFYKFRQYIICRCEARSADRGKKCVILSVAKWLDSPSPFRRAYARHLPRFIGGVYPRPK